ncbi:helix-turn-helix domain-containing protein [Sphingobacterium sp. MYb382]|uniref:helix-turn-helix domain-containing protein n=1 Tax=Sphingobacterium sp. MYb382 TaxID=2745278 RepID=UPI003095AA0A
MTSIESYLFKPINNPQQQVHIITIAERLKKGGKSLEVPHRTDFYILYILSEGRAKHMIDFQEIDVKVGDVLVISPSQVHKFIKTEDYDGYLIAFPKVFLYQTVQNKLFIENAQIFNNVDLLTKFFFDAEGFQEILGIIEKMKGELSKPYDEFQAPILNNLLSNILFLLERRWTTLRSSNDLQHSKSSKDYLYVATYKKMIKEEFKEATTVKHYANKLNISERKLQKVVMDILGKSPKELIDEQVILESKRLLVHESMNVKEVAYAMGFDEPSYFTKFFRGKVGIAPTQFKLENTSSPNN